ncbi:AAA family ATPase [Humibacter soli]
MFRFSRGVTGVGVPRGVGDRGVWQTPHVDFQPPVVAIRRRDDADDRPGTWPRTVPAVSQLLDDGLRLPPGVTFLVGENGSGKSTIVEGVAMAYGFSPEGGSAFAQHSTRRSESPLSEWLQLQRGIGAGRWGFFLRAETMHSFYTYLEGHPSPRDPAFHNMSHGESFLAILETRFDSPGFYCLDEPEAALSFSSTLTLIATLQRIVDEGGQVLCATHSPVLAALPDANILEIGDWGLRQTSWDDLELVQHWRSYLDAPERYLRHLL